MMTITYGTKIFTQAIIFLVAGLNHLTKVVIEGAHRKGKCVEPYNVKQEEVSAHKKKKLEEVVGNIKVSVSYPEEHKKHSIVVVSIYDKKPACLMPYLAKSTQWLKKTRKFGRMRRMQAWIFQLQMI